MTVVTAALTALADLVWPSTCAGCTRPGGVRAQGDRLPWCPDCEVALGECLWPGGPRRCRPQPCPPGLPPVHAAGVYAAPLSRVVAAWKDEGRRDADVLLGPLLRSAVGAAVDAAGPARGTSGADSAVLVVPVPSAAAAVRRRGGAPLKDLAATALRLAPAPDRTRGPRLADVLRLRRRVADQAGLGARERAVNLEHAMDVRPRQASLVAGADCVLVDDVLTTGATLVEAARALRSAGARSVVAATVCATQRRRAPSGAPSVSSR